MNVEQANKIIEQDKDAREEQRRAKEAARLHYRVYWVNPITSLLHQLPFVDIYDETNGADVRLHLLFSCDCSLEEARNAVATADTGKMGVCVKSRWTTYLVERLK